MKLKELIHELKHHTPFTIFATLIALISVVLIEYYFQKKVSQTLFEVFHPAHIIASAMVTSGIFYKYKTKFFQALFVGIVGSIIIGSLSDVIVPWIGGNLLSLKTVFHLPLIEEPTIILTSAIIGSLVGIKTKITKIPHFTHVFLSVFASLLYLLAFSQAFSFTYFIAVFFIVFVAVIVPCCLSDIIFPFIFLGEKIKHCGCK